MATAKSQGSGLGSIAEQLLQQQDTLQVLEEEQKKREEKLPEGAARKRGSIGPVAGGINLKKSAKEMWGHLMNNSRRGYALLQQNGELAERRKLLEKKIGNLEQGKNSTKEFFKVPRVNVKVRRHYDESRMKVYYCFRCV